MAVTMLLFKVDCLTVAVRLQPDWELISFTRSCRMEMFSF